MSAKLSCLKVPFATLEMLKPDGASERGSNLTESGMHPDPEQRLTGETEGNNVMLI